MVTIGQILVGVDGSAESMAAVEWAAAEADSRNARLLIVHIADAHAYGLWGTTKTIRQGLRELARPVVDRAVRLALSRHPSVAVRGRVILGSPVRAMVRLSDLSDLTVVGRRGRGAISRFVLGSITQRLMTHGHRTIVAVGSSPQELIPSGGGSVILGVCDHPGQEPATRFAFAEAARRGVGVHAVHAWSVGALPPPGVPTALAYPAQLQSRADRLVQSAVADLRQEYPRTTVTTAALEGDPGLVLPAACNPADLLVLAQHFHPAWTPQGLGPVIAAALHDAPCPVAVVCEQAVAKAQMVTSSRTAVS
jgi:nucleotide-binding universal stress UspA family protein